MLVSRRNKEYKKQCWTGVGIMSFLLITMDGMYLYIIYCEYVNYHIKDTLICIAFLIILTLLFAPFIYYYFYEAINEFIFEDKTLIIKNKYGIKRKIELNDSVRCEFFPQEKVFHGMYSDAILFCLKRRRPIAIYEEFNDEFYSVRDWLLENGIKIEAFTDPSNKYCLGEKDPSYQYFLKAEPMKKKMPSPKEKHNKVGSKATIKTNKNWVLKRGFISTITIFGLIYCRYIFPINSLGQLMEKIMVALIVIALSGLAAYGLGALLSIELTVVDDKLKIKKVGRVKEYNLQKDVTNIEYKESVKDHSGNYGNQLNFCIGNKIYKFNSTEYPDLDKFVSVLRENTDVIDY